MLVGLQNDRVCLLGRVLIRCIVLFVSLNAHGPRSMVISHRWFDSYVVRRGQTVRRLTIELPSIGDGDRQHPQLLLRKRRRWETKQGEGSIQLLFILRPIRLSYSHYKYTNRCTNRSTNILIELFSLFPVPSFFEKYFQGGRVAPLLPASEGGVVGVE